MAVTAKARARTALLASINLSQSDTLDVVKAATNLVKGGGTSLMTSGVVNVGAQIHVEEEHQDRLGLSITSGKRVVELCTFAAIAVQEDSWTSLTVGGLQTYKTSQSRLLGIIPVGPASIPGFSLYKRYLTELQAQLQAADPQASISIQDPTAA
jgi:hypothetical protein